MGAVYFEDVAEGSVLWGSECCADRAEMLAYARANDPWPFHVDEEAARRTPFGGLIASAGYTITLAYRSSNAIFNTDAAAWAFLGALEWRVKFLRPLRPGDRVRARVTVLGKRLSGKPGRGVVTSLLELVNQDDQVVYANEVVCLVATRPGATA